MGKKLRERKEKRLKEKRRKKLKARKEKLKKNRKIKAIQMIKKINIHLIQSHQRMERKINTLIQSHQMMGKKIRILVQRIRKINTQTMNLMKRNKKKQKNEDLQNHLKILSSLILTKKISEAQQPVVVWKASPNQIVVLSNKLHCVGQMHLI